MSEAPLLTPPEAPLIAAQNDAFRSHAGLPGPAFLAETEIPGIVLFTSGVQAMRLIDQAVILQQVREFHTWTEDNDPYGEHDFGVIEHEDERLYFKFDYYDPDYQWGSEHPDNLAETARVLTIMLAHEY